ESIINILLTRRVLQFLANRQALVAGRLAAALLSRPLLQVQQRSSQQTSYALTSGVNFATLVILGQGVVLVTEGTLLVVLAAGLFLVSPIVTAFTIAFFVAVGLILQRLLSGWAGRVGQRATHAEVASYSVIQEALRTYRETVVAHRRADYVSRFQAVRWESAQVQADLQFMSLVPKYVFEIALVIGAALLAGSQLLTKDVSAAIAIIALFLAAGSRVVPSMLRLQGAMITIRGGAGQAAPTYELADELGQLGGGSGTPDPALPPAEIKARLIAGHGDFDPSISLKGIRLAYPGSEALALDDVTLDISAGRSLALVGPTGAGKSTLADVILGVLQADSGEALVGGQHPLTAVARWPGAIAYVPQDVAMANGTVRENVALGLPLEAIDDSWVWDALERAHLAVFLRDNREGLDTLIGEHGLKLSGGQRQRLGVARALYSRPKLLVLDEATSALDAETERIISMTLASLEGQVTTVTVAHRLATIMHCDSIAYLENGRVTAFGTFDEVRAMEPNFDHQARLLGL
ncbi:MAG: ABC transporter ATP-binding protein, partial [Actinobacteria bacterium]|nr:ABC transporter ATP-binding protein [Actinomycetota bacterium]